MNKNCQRLVSKILKTTQKKIQDYDETELSEFLADLSDVKYQNMILSRAKSAKASGKICLLIHYSVLYNKVDGCIVRNDTNFKWLDDLVFNNKDKIDVYIYSPIFRDNLIVEEFKRDLIDNNYENLIDNVFFSGQFIDDSIYIYSKAYIYQGKLPDFNTISSIASR